MGMHTHATIVWLNCGSKCYISIHSVLLQAIYEPEMMNQSQFMAVV